MFGPKLNNYTSNFHPLKRVKFRLILDNAIMMDVIVEQVEVEINTIPSKCTGVCSFTWSEASTPVISAITPASGKATDPP